MCAERHWALHRAVITVTVVFWRANYCVNYAEGGPAAGSGLNSSS